MLGRWLPCVISKPLSQSSRTESHACSQASDWQIAVLGDLAGVFLKSSSLHSIQSRVSARKRNRRTCIPSFAQGFR